MRVHTVTRLESGFDDGFELFGHDVSLQQSTPILVDRMRTHLSIAGRCMQNIASGMDYLYVELAASALAIRLHKIKRTTFFVPLIRFALGCYVKRMWVAPVLELRKYTPKA
jgi:hypothetical protein